MEFTIDQRERYDFHSALEAHYEWCKVEADLVIVKEIDEILKMENQRKRQIRIIAIRKNLDGIFVGYVPHYSQRHCKIASHFCNAVDINMAWTASNDQ